MVTTSLLGTPTPITCTHEVAAKPVELTLIVYVPAVCSNADKDGLSVRVPDANDQADEDNVVPLTVTPVAVTPLRQVALSVNVIVNGLSTVTPAAAVSAGEFGATILKGFDVTEVMPGLLNTMVAPVTGPRLVAVRASEVNETLPDEAVADVLTPPRVHVPAPTVAVITAELVVRLPYWSTIVRVGCVASVPPLVEGPTGCAPITNLLAAPGSTCCTTEEPVYPDE